MFKSSKFELVSLINAVNDSQDEVLLLTIPPRVVNRKFNSLKKSEIEHSHQYYYPGYVKRAQIKLE